MTELFSGKQILYELNERAAEIRQRFQVNQIGLFGSYAREEAHTASDIDILVDFIAPTFDNYMNLKFYLEDLFEQEVDLVTASALKPRLKPVILQEVQYVQGLQALPR